MITFVCFKWGTKYSPKHVHTLARMVERHFSQPHRFICLTDDPEGVEVQTAPLDPKFANLGSRRCFPKLAIYAPDAASRLGERICSMDLDMVITDNLEPIVSRKEDFVIASGPLGFFQGSLQLLAAGRRPQAYDDFTPMEALRKTRAARKPCVDDVWLGVRLGMKEARFTAKDGVYSFQALPDSAKPDNGRLVYFNGPNKPDGPVAQRLAWVRENYQ